MFHHRLRCCLRDSPLLCLVHRNPCKSLSVALNPSPLSTGSSGCATFSNENFAHHSHSVNVFARTTEGKFCKCCLHVSVSKRWRGVLISRNTSDLGHVAFLPGPSPLSFVHVNGGVGYENFMPSLMALPYSEPRLTQKNRDVFHSRNVRSIC